MSGILLVDDNPEILALTQERLELEGFQVATASDRDTALAKIVSLRPQLVILDVYLQRGENGVEILQQIRSNHGKHELPVLIITGQPDSDLALRAMQGGANDFILKPIAFEQLLAKIGQLLQTRDSQLPLPPWEEKIVGSSKQMIDIIMAIYHASQAEADTFIWGETGTGKDLVARMIHRLSRRAQVPLVTIDCPCIPKELFESEVFGHEKNAFNNAPFKKGRIEEGGEGVVFFDEIGDLTLEHQAKLLNFWDKKSFCRLGGNKRIQLNVMLLAATNRNLKEMVAAGRFREDFFYRLLGNVIQVPPLREHKQDIPLLCEHMMAKYARLFGKKVTGISAGALAAVEKKSWPGNVRDLERHVLRAVLQAGGAVLEEQDFVDAATFFQTRAEDDGDGARWNGLLAKDYKTAYEQMQHYFHCEYLTRHLIDNQWNVSRTAKQIGISREYVTKLMKEYSIKRPEQE
ncbi:sigma-54-dependent Fis family transcriptional regulator [candidate division FCPU426 bacterium]|nr:sigma-54-dependent Fis family transcriptional regulator [candidate division FCPU426 bacterium]